MATPPPLADVLRDLEQAAPRLYSRWSPQAWKLVCSGPAVRLWDALSGSAEGQVVLSDYLFLAREAIGMQYLAATRPEDLAPGAPGHGFLAVAFCELLPRILPSAPAKTRSQLLTQLWNVGEKLVGKPVWLDRYLAARLPELTDPSRFEEFLGKVVAEGLDEQPPATWQGKLAVSVVDPGGVDRAFLPDLMHLATPSVVCVHDRRRDDRNVAVLLRRGGSVCLGVTPCLGGDTAVRFAAPAGFLAKARNVDPGAGLSILSAPSGFVILTAELSQRLWVVESEH